MTRSSSNTTAIHGVALLMAAPGDTGFLSTDVHLNGVLCSARIRGIRFALIQYFSLCLRASRAHIFEYLCLH